MDRPDTLPLETPLPRPCRGSSTRVQVGATELVLESVRGGCSLLWLDGRESRRYALGLTDAGHLTLQVRPPRWPCRVVVREVMSVVPGGRLHGYLQVPLVPTIVWHDAFGTTMPLVELPPRDLAPEWDDRVGAVYRCTSSLHVRFPMRTGELRAAVPVRIRNRSTQALSPAYVPMHLAQGDLREARGSVLVAPRRLDWNGSEWATPAAGPTTEVRA